MAAFSEQKQAGLGALLESHAAAELPAADYRQLVREHYDGPAGDFTVVSGLLTGHAIFPERLLRFRQFDLRGCKMLLDAACGNGRYTRDLLRHADPDAFVAAFDFAHEMLKRASKTLPPDRVGLVAADMTRLPYAEASFDAVVCGWALEHLPDPRPGLREFARVLRPQGKLLLLVTEDTLPGMLTSRLWHCRTHNRADLKRICAECGLRWERTLWFSPLHRFLRLGGIVVELRRVTEEPRA